jgi:hypothetical protein
MDIGKLQQAIEGIRRHLAAGDKEAAIALLSESMGVHRKAAEQAIEQMVSNQPAAVSQTVELNEEDVGRQIRQILQAVPGGAVAGTILRFAGLDLSKIAGAVTIEGEGSSKTVHMTLPTMRLPGSSQREAAEPVDAPAGQPARAPDESPRHVSVLDRPHDRTVERTRGLGIVGLAVLLLALAAAAAVAVILLRQG